MSSEPPPVISTVFNEANWTNTTGSNATKTWALYNFLSRRINDTAQGIISFTNGIVTNTIAAKDPNDDVNLYTTTIGPDATITIGNEQTPVTNIFHPTLYGLNCVNLFNQSVSLASWNAVSSNIGLPNVGSSIQQMGYAITPTLGSIAFYPQSAAPIVFTVFGVYNVQATFQFTFSAINSTGRVAVGVSTNSSTGDWLYASNGNLNNNIYRSHVGTINAAVSPLVYSVNFTAALGSNLYLKYEIQASSYTGTLIVNYVITRVA